MTEKSELMSSKRPGDRSKKKRMLYKKVLHVELVQGSILREFKGNCPGGELP